MFLDSHNNFLQKRIRKRPICDDYVYDPVCERQQSTSFEESMEAPVQAPQNPTVAESNKVLCNTDHPLTTTSGTYSSNPPLHCAQYAAVNTSTVEAEDVLYISYFDDVGREEEIYYQDSTTLLDP